MFTPGSSEEHGDRSDSRAGESRPRHRRVLRRVNPVEPTFAQRYECKYLVSPMLLPEIRAFLGPFAEPDAFAARRPGFRYPICSLYLDSGDLALYRQTVHGEKDRFKLRVRTYSDDPASQAFFEVKRKANNIVHKRRTGLSRADAESALTGRIEGIAERLGDRRRDDFDYFTLHSHRIESRPVVRVRYLREAYQATGNEPVRVTIDTDLAHAVTLDSELGHERGSWTETPLAGAIVEIKFTDRFPWWVEEFIRRFGMNQRAVPKYVLCLEQALRRGRSVLALNGFDVPVKGS